MLLSPQIGVGAVPGREIVFRLEDFLLIIITLTWFVKVAIDKELALFKKTPLNFAMGIYILVYCFATLRGMLIGSVVPLKGFFYLLKYVEYFLFYFMAINLIQTRRQAEFFMTMFILVCVITAIYADLHIGGGGRTSAPFEKSASGEPNTLGGYLIIMIAVIMGIFLQIDSSRIRFLLVVSLVFIVPAFLFTLSRTSYIAFVPMWIALIIFNKRKILLTVLLLSGIVWAVAYLPAKVQKRVEYTFSGELEQGIKPVVIAGKTLDPSSSSRINSWFAVLDEWKERPIFGYGTTGVGFIDSQHVLLLGETGIVGVLAYIFLLHSIFKHAKKIFREAKDKFFRGLSLGFLAGFIGLIFFNIGANGFILIKVMEPFWFLTAVVMLIPKLEAEPAES